MTSNTVPTTQKLTRDIADILRDSLLFSDLDEPILREFANAAITKYTPKGSIIFLHGDKADCFYLIVNGWVKLFQETLDGSEAVIDVLNKGCIFGETSLFEDYIYSHNAQALEDTVLLMLPLSLLKQKILGDSKLSMNMFSAMTKRSRLQEKELEHRDLQSAPQRVGCFLLRLCQANATGKVTLHLPYDKSLIASRLGMKAETFSRALTRLKQDTDIHVNGSSITLDSVEQMSSYCCGACSSSFPCKDLL